MKNVKTSKKFGQWEILDNGKRFYFKTLSAAAKFYCRNAFYLTHDMPHICNIITGKKYTWCD
jgi:hypothetical protein